MSHKTQDGKVAHSVFQHHLQYQQYGTDVEPLISEVLKALVIWSHLLALERGRENMYLKMFLLGNKIPISEQLLLKAFEACCLSVSDEFFP